MKLPRPLKSVSFILAGSVITALGVQAQQITGTPGSPSATTTIDGRQLPAPPGKFEGVIRPTTVGSKPYWQPRIVPPKGAPNILLIMTDDAGYGVSSTFGGVIPTPALDRIAQNGLRYTNFNSTSERIRARRWTTRITRCRSTSRARSTRSRSRSTGRS